ncbi:NADH-cytochrome b5 reductase [Anaeramoeba flamelloides]|uniref:NADH-cytochrome b5 reductase n=1 Tax=Anaeramoeba flamelloides TaxID=1746091 RepID=A0AAV7YBV6_9EUKA|nr:NADH-cytochrome b5 reductase [Anaeramoeba flamelloides]KAJ6235383.1 NADH-cytochrome b5 reductase [Anaeramoeba flamelloides]|eukprot:Anaeramoba_flamelloidesc37677_g1_i2.p1 GENE.c37677_g1_i2~~c37677_g1_i2.p1  ORF type:complete len:269 (-),score=57.56 c37677_g1_i2:19-825(-)
MYKITERIETFTDLDGITHKSALHPGKWTFVTLAKKEKVSSTKSGCPIYTFKFSFPQETDQLGSFSGQYIAVKAKIKNKFVKRFYSPTSTPSDHGFVEILVKVNSERIGMSGYLEKMKIGQKIEMMGPVDGFIYKPGNYKQMVLLSAGVGVSPMVQLARSVMKNSEDKTKIVFLHGNISENELVLFDEIKSYQENFPDQFTYTYALEKPGENWDGGEGFISKEIIEKHIDLELNPQIVMCGPKGFTNAMTKIVKIQMNLPKEQVFSYW